MRSDLKSDLREVFLWQISLDPWQISLDPSLMPQFIIDAQLNRNEKKELSVQW